MTTLEPTMYLRFVQDGKKQMLQQKWRVTSPNGEVSFQWKFVRLFIEDKPDAPNDGTKVREATEPDSHTATKVGGGPLKG